VLCCNFVLQTAFLLTKVRPLTLLSILCASVVQGSLTSLKYCFHVCSKTLYQCEMKWGDSGTVVEKSFSNQKVASLIPCRSVPEQDTEPLIAPDVQCAISV